MRRWITAAALFGMLASIAGVMAPVAIAKPGCRGARVMVGPRVTCVRVGQRCSARDASDYLRVDLACVPVRHRRVLRHASLSALRQGRVLDLGPSGRPTLQQARWEFAHTVAPLPGVRVPAGAVGRDPSGTSAIRNLDHYRNRLTRRQRARLDAILRGPRDTVAVPAPAAALTAGLPAVAAVPPPAATATATATAPARSARVTGLGDYVALTTQAQARLIAHGMVFRHPITLARVGASGDEYANALPQWLYGSGNACAIEIRPAALRVSLASRRANILHELMHCADAEQAATRNAYDSLADYFEEGLPEWAAYRVGVEWSGSAGDDLWWPAYFTTPYTSVLTKAYDAVGWWSLAEHDGLDLWALEPALVRAGGAGQVSAPLELILNAAPSSFVSDWGTTLATDKTLGPKWDLNGPSMPQRSEPSASVDNGGSWGHVVGRAAGYEAKLSLTADIVRVQGVTSVKGVLRDAAGDERPISSDTRYCTIEGGCTCRDGKTLPFAQISPGEARVGFADANDVGSVVITGESLDSYCKATPVTGLQIRGAGSSIHATFKSGTCTAAKGAFHATASDGAWSLDVRIRSFDGYKKVYPLVHGGDPSFVINGPGGPYSNAYAAPNHGPEFGQIQFYPGGGKMSLGFEYAWNAGGDSAVLPIGVMTCKRKKR